MTTLDDSETDTLPSKYSTKSLIPALEQTPSQGTAPPSTTLPLPPKAGIEEEQSTKRGPGDPAPDMRTLWKLADLDNADEFKDKIVAKITHAEDHNFIIINEDKTRGKIWKCLVSEEVLSVSSSFMRSLIRVPTEDQTSRIQEPSKGVSSLRAIVFEGVKGLYIEHDAYALQAILRIIHFRPDTKLWEISIPTWAKITVAAEKYGWVTALQPWKTIWLGNHRSSFLNPGHEDWLYISKVFGSHHQVDALITLLAEHCGVNGTVISRYNLKTKSYRSLDTKLWPEERKGMYIRCYEALQFLSWAY
ncbi:hypothetical protein TWF481_009882 [Arthrobotrys musiformis]|uniref:BTB domain-containing protein n=1 Tax=Arthrobotrys musiformis TaxID=47236 RepID=A0AAV9W548_9PEZI